MQTGSQVDRLPDSQPIRQADRQSAQTGSQTVRQSVRQSDSLTVRQSVNESHRQIVWQTGRPADRQAGRQTGRPATRYLGQTRRRDRHRLPDHGHAGLLPPVGPDRPASVDGGRSARPAVAGGGGRVTTTPIHTYVHMYIYIYMCICISMGICRFGICQKSCPLTGKKKQSAGAHPFGKNITLEEGLGHARAARPPTHSHGHTLKSTAHETLPFSTTNRREEPAPR